MNPELEYATFHLIKSCEGYCEKYRFYKLMYLLDNELIDLGMGWISLTTGIETELF